MPIQYTNRRGKTYYLHRHTTKGGRVGYHFSLDDDGDLVEEIPAGYEIYEHPRGQVFLRKKRDPIVTEDEVNIVRSEVEKRANVDHFLIDVRDKAIVVHTADQDLSRLQDVFSSFALDRPHYPIYPSLSGSPPSSPPFCTSWCTFSSRYT